MSGGVRFQRFTQSDVMLVREWAAWLGRGIPYPGISHPADRDAAMRAENLADRIATWVQENSERRTYHFRLEQEDE